MRKKRCFYAQVAFVVVSIYASLYPTSTSGRYEPIIAYWLWKLYGWEKIEYVGKNCRLALRPEADLVDDGKNCKFTAGMIPVITELSSYKGAHRFS